jgi:lipid-A-disaccharide synthase
MKYYLIAGERSGDMHAANLMRALKEEDSAANFRCWGGDQMEAVAGELVQHYRDMAFMGFWEVLKNLGTIRKFMRQCQADLLAHRPDVLILVDYAGFNMRMAKFAKAHGIPVFYYISPKVWAWNTKRAYKIKRFVSRMFVILPFEVAFFKRFDYEVDYVGNPIWDAIHNFRPSADFRQRHQLSEDPIVAVLPGSRFQEVKAVLGDVLRIRSQFPDYQFVIAGVNNLPPSLYKAAQHTEGIHLVFEETYDLLSEATAAVVTSGTATLETALFGVPQVVVYRTSALTYRIIKTLIRVPYISLVNLIANKPVVTELIQHEFRPERLREELKRILPNNPGRKAVQDGYAHLLSQMGEPGASSKAAKKMWQYLNEK